MANLMDGLISEIDRNRGLIKLYEEIPTGGFAIMMIQKDIDAGNKALVSNDVVEMLRAYTGLKENK